MSWHGDFTVTQGGVHTQAYLGDCIRIEADPGLPARERVINVQAPIGRMNS